MTGGLRRISRPLAVAWLAGMCSASLAMVLLPGVAAAGTVQLSGQVVQVDKSYTVNGTASCEALLVLQINAGTDIVNYSASVDQKNIGERDFSGPPFSNPITYGDISYTVPPGSHGWFLGYGGGPGPCGDGAASFTNIRASGVQGQTHVLSGRIKDRAGHGAGGVTVNAAATGGGASASAVTASNGDYSVSLIPGSYRVTPSAGSDTFSPAATNVDLFQGNQTADFTLVSAEHHITIGFRPSSVSGSGNGIVEATITDQDQDGAPVVGADVRIEPPVEYGTGGVPEGLLCDDSDRLASPFRLNDGSVLGRAFTRTTDGAGQIHLSLYVGTVGGDWTLDAYEPGRPGAPRASGALPVGGDSGSGVLPDALTSLLIAAGNNTLANFSQSGQRNVLEWLGEVAGEVHGIGFAPIYGVDPTGATNPGVVLFADDPGVRTQVLSYLDGSSSVPPDGSKAVVIDVKNMQEFLLGTRLAGHLVNQTPYRLPSLSEWSNGTVIQIADPDVQAFHNSTHIPIPARGRARFGLLEPTGNESLLYGYGPYPPFAGTAQQAAALNHCVGGSFNLTSIVPHSPISVTVTGGGGTVGVNTHGAPVDSLRGAVLRYRNGKARSILMPSGRYQLRIVGTGSGPATLVLTSQTRAGSVTRVFSFAVRRGVRGTIAVGGAGLGNVMRLGNRLIRAQDGLGVAIHGLPHRLARRRTKTIAMRLVDQFGQAAAGVTVSIRGAGLRRLEATTDTRGRLRLSVRPTRRGTVVLAIGGTGYQRANVRLAVR